MAITEGILRIIGSFRYAGMKDDVEKILTFLGIGHGMKEAGDAEYEHKKSQMGAINKELYELFKPYVYDFDQNKLKTEYVDKPGSTFWDRLYRHLASGKFGIGSKEAIQHIDDIVSHLKEHHDTYIHAAEKTLKGAPKENVDKRPIGSIKMKSDDPNWSIFLEDQRLHKVDKGLAFKMEVVREDDEDMYSPIVRFRKSSSSSLSARPSSEGGEPEKKEQWKIDPKEYKMDTSTSRLYLEEGHTYNVKLESFSEGKFIIDIEGATRGWHEHARIPADAIHKVLEYAVVDYKRTKYRDDITSNAERSRKEFKDLVKKYDAQKEIVQDLYDEVISLRKQLPEGGDSTKLPKEYHDKEEKLKKEAEKLEDIREDVEFFQKEVVPELRTMDWGPMQEPIMKGLMSDYLALQKEDKRFLDPLLSGSRIRDVDLKSIFNVKMAFEDPDGPEFMIDEDEKEEEEKTPHKMIKDIGPGGLGGRGSPAEISPERIEQFKDELLDAVGSATGVWESSGSKIPYKDLMTLFFHSLGMGDINHPISGWEGRFVDGLKHYGDAHDMVRFQNADRNLVEIFKRQLARIINDIPRLKKMNESRIFRGLKQQMRRAVDELRKVHRDVYVGPRSEEQAFSKEISSFWASPEKDFKKLADIFRRIQKAQAGGLSIFDTDYIEFFWKPTEAGFHKLIHMGRMDDVSKMLSAMKGVLPDTKYKALEQVYRSSVKSEEFGKTLETLWQHPMENMGKLIEIYNELGKDMTDITGHVWTGSVDGFRTLLDKNPHQAIQAIQKLSGETYMDHELLGFLRETILSIGLKSDAPKKIQLWGLYMQAFGESVRHKGDDEIKMLKKLTSEVLSLISEDEELRQHLPGKMREEIEDRSKKEHRKKEKKLELTDIEEILNKRYKGEMPSFDISEAPKI